MKNINKIFLLLIASAGTFLSCTKEENKIFLDGGTPPVLTASVTSTILPLSFATKDNVGLILNWTNPAYMFTTGLSSQDVTYRIEFDTTGANFTSPQKATIGMSKELSRTFTQADINDILFNQMKLVGGMPHNIDIRVVASLTNDNAPLASNVIKYTITPYIIPPKVTPPTTGKLYIVGSATNGDWSNPVPVPSQEFTRLSNTLYEITVPLKAGGFYLLLPLNGDWGVKYGAIGGNGSNNANGDDFRMGGGDLGAPSTAGTYKITVDFQAGKFTVTKV